MEAPLRYPFRHTWQAYGYYADNGNSLWAGAVKASNEFMARAAILKQTHDLSPVITTLRKVEEQTWKH